MIKYCCAANVALLTLLVINIGCRATRDAMCMAVAPIVSLLLVCLAVAFLLLAAQRLEWNQHATAPTEPPSPWDDEL